MTRVMTITTEHIHPTRLRRRVSQDSMHLNGSTSTYIEDVFIDRDIAVHWSVCLLSGGRRYNWNVDVHASSADRTGDRNELVHKQKSKDIHH